MKARFSASIYPVSPSFAPPVAYSRTTALGPVEVASFMISMFWLLRYSVMLRRNSWERVKSCCSQIELTVASRPFGTRNAVDGSDIFNVLLLLVVYDGVYDVLLFSYSGDKTGRNFYG